MVKTSVVERISYNPVKGSYRTDKPLKAGRDDIKDATPETCLNCPLQKCTGSRKCYIKMGGK